MNKSLCLFVAFTAIGLCGLAVVSHRTTANDHFAATCKGENPCKACKNCNSCKHCHTLGKTCGVCKSGK